MRVQLPVQFPFLTSYTHHAALVAMLSVDEGCLPWIYECYLQTFAFVDPGLRYVSVDYLCGTEALHRCPWLRIQVFRREDMLRREADVATFFKRQLDEGRYVYVGVDEYEIAAYEAYGKERKPHPLFVYGYDDERRVFFAGDFFRHHQYAIAEIAYEQFAAAYANTDEAHPFRKLNYLISRREAPACELSGRTIAAIASDALRAELTAPYAFLPECDPRQHRLSQEPPQSYRIGLRGGELLLSNLYSHLMDERPYDRRAFGVLADHMKLTVRLVDHLEERSMVDECAAAALRERFGEAAKFAEAAKLHMLKYEWKGEGRERYVPEATRLLMRMLHAEKQGMAMLRERLQVAAP